MANQELLEVWDNLGYGEAIEDYAGRLMERSSLLDPNGGDCPIVKDLINPAASPQLNCLSNWMLVDKKTFDERWIVDGTPRNNGPVVWHAHGKVYQVLRRGVVAPSPLWAKTIYFISSQNPVCGGISCGKVNPLINTPVEPIAQVDPELTVFSTVSHGRIPTWLLRQLQDKSPKETADASWENYNYLSCDDIPQYLANKKGLDIKTIPDGFFSQREYLNLVRSYLDLIAVGADPTTGKRIYSKSADFNILIAASKIDCALATVVFNYILAFESLMNVTLNEAICGTLTDKRSPLCKDTSLLGAYLTKGDALPCFRSIGSNDFEEDSSLVEEIIGKRGKILSDLIDSVKKPNDLCPEAEIFFERLHYVPLFVGIPLRTFSEKLTLLQMLPYQYQEKFVFAYLCKDKKSYRSNVHVGKEIRSLSTALKIRNLISHHQSFFGLVRQADQFRFGTIEGVLVHLRNYYEHTTFLVPDKPNIPYLDVHISNSYNRNLIIRINEIIDIVNHKNKKTLQ